MRVGFSVHVKLLKKKVKSYLRATADAYIGDKPERGKRRGEKTTPTERRNREIYQKKNACARMGSHQRTQRLSKGGKRAMSPYFRTQKCSRVAVEKQTRPEEGIVILKRRKAGV